MVEEAAEEAAAERGRDTEVRCCGRLSLWLVSRNIEYLLTDMHRGRRQRARLPQPAPSL